MTEWTRKYKVTVQPGDEIIETVSAYEAEGYLRMLELRLAEKDKERAKVEQHWSDYAQMEVRGLVEETQKKLAEKDKELERINTDNKQLYERSLDKDVTIARQLTEKTEKDKEIERLKGELKHANEVLLSPDEVSHG
jgi:hypothetical protein